MIDLKAARADPEAFRAAVARKGAGKAFDALLEADARWRELVPQVDELRGRQKIQGKPSPEQVEELKQVKEDLRRARGRAVVRRGRARRATAKGAEPAARVRSGRGDGGRRRGRSRRRRPARTGRAEGAPRARSLRHGARGTGLRLAVRLPRRRHGSPLAGALPLGARPRGRGRVHARAPARARTRGGHVRHRLLPGREERVLRDRRRRPLSTGTSEVALAGLHMGEILEATSCRFATRRSRRTSGARRAPRGAIPAGCSASISSTRWRCSRTRVPEASWDEFERILELEEQNVKELGLPYRVLNIAAGDLSAAAAKRYDIEAWFPSQERYRELTSASNTTDFQARRLGNALSRGERPGARAHAERHRGHRPMDARDPGELPGRRA